MIQGILILAHKNTEQLMHLIGPQRTATRNTTIMRLWPTNSIGKKYLTWWELDISKCCL